MCQMDRKKTEDLEKSFSGEPFEFLSLNKNGKTKNSLVNSVLSVLKFEFSQMGKNTSIFRKSKHLLL